MNKKTIIGWIVYIIIAMIIGSILMRLIRDMFIAMGVLFVVLVVGKVGIWLIMRKIKKSKEN